MQIKINDVVTSELEDGEYYITEVLNNGNFKGAKLGMPSTSGDIEIREGDIDTVNGKRYDARS